MACSPTPKVSWQKVGGKIADKASIRSSGLELIIPTVDASDAGVYRCSAHNTAKENAISVDITLDVQCEYQKRQLCRSHILSRRARELIWNRGLHNFRMGSVNESILYSPSWAVDIGHS